jgi:hypothetical protein
MSYTIALVTDNTPDTLEYGDYRGFVVLDGGTGECLTQADSMAHATAWVAEKLGVGTADVQTERAYSEEYGDPQGVWEVKQS